MITDNRAEKIIQGLEQYYAEKGEYPDNLEMLATDYFDSVPSTAYGVFGKDF